MIKFLLIAIPLYLLIGIITAVIHIAKDGFDYEYYFNDDNNDMLAYVLFWPVMLIIDICMLISKAIKSLALRLAVLIQSISELEKISKKRKGILEEPTESEDDKDHLDNTIMIKTNARENIIGYIATKDQLVSLDDKQFPVKNGYFISVSKMEYDESTGYYTYKRDTALESDPNNLEVNITDA